MTQWFVSPKKNNRALVRLFCFPYAGGGSHGFRAWSEQLPDTVEVQAAQLPGRGPRLREAPLTQMAPLVEALAKSLTDYQDKPFVFFGHSMGARVAFALAAHLERQGQASPAHLFASAAVAPHLPDTPALAALPDAEFLAALRQLNGMPQEVWEHAELLELLLPALRADCALAEAYLFTESAPLSCAITACGGLRDELVTREQLAAWAAQTRAVFTLRMFPGDHFFLHSAEPLLLSILAQALQRAARAQCP